MFRKLLQTRNDLAPVAARLALAVAIFPHGAQKVLGVFGGYGFTATLQAFSQHFGIPAPLAILAFAAEFLGPLGLATGFLTRIAAFGIAVDMAVAAFAVHLSNGFFMNWTGQQAGEGFEYHLLALGLAIVLMITGGGRGSVDGLITRRGKA